MADLWQIYLLDKNFCRPLSPSLSSFISGSRCSPPTPPPPYLKVRIRHWYGVVVNNKKAYERVPSMPKMTFKRVNPLSPSSVQDQFPP